MWPARGSTRVLRAGILGAVILALAGAAHTLGGGELPPLGVLLGAAAGTTLVAAAVTARRCRFVPLLVVTGVVQVVLHYLFSLSGALTTCTPTGGLQGSGHSGGHAATLACADPMGAASLSSAPMMTHGGPAMLIMHVLATLATVWLLARGEAWVWALVDHAVHVATAEPRPLPPVSTYPAIARHTPARLARTAGGTAAPRGPPALLTI